jgi:hypothetical protein
MSKNIPLAYTKRNPFEHIVKPSHTLDELLLLIGDDENESKPYEWCDDPAKYIRELRSNGWNRCNEKKGLKNDK